jgi:hypothetical protein
VDLNSAIKFIQGHFTDGLVLVIGSGLSVFEGLPGMPALANHLTASAAELRGEDAAAWSDIDTALKLGNGLESALLEHPPTESLETWIRDKTCELLAPKEREVIAAVIRKERTLSLTTFLSKILRPPGGLPILTPTTTA